jgi:hypothetical protein
VKKFSTGSVGGTLTVIASEAKQSSSAAQHWIASSLRSSQ